MTKVRKSKRIVERLGQSPHLVLPLQTLPTSAPPQRPVKVQTGFYRSGLALLASSPAEVADVLWVVRSGNMSQGNTVMKGQATVEMEGHVWALDDVVSNSKLDDFFLASFSGRTPPCTATQHCTSARKL